MTSPKGSAKNAVRKMAARKPIRDGGEARDRIAKMCAKRWPKDIPWRSKGSELFGPHKKL